MVDEPLNDGSDVAGYIGTFATLSQNWDSYGAEATSAEAIAAAQRLARSVRAWPTVNGGVSVTFADEGLSIEIGDDGRLLNVLLELSELRDFIENAPSGSIGGKA